jgi:hypothetical protein
VRAAMRARHLPVAVLGSRQGSKCAIPDQRSQVRNEQYQGAKPNDAEQPTPKMPAPPWGGRSSTASSPIWAGANLWTLLMSTKLGSTCPPCPAHGRVPPRFAAAGLMVGRPESGAIGESAAPLPTGLPGDALVGGAVSRFEIGATLKFFAKC